ncbi:type II toxin-antitoxin system VapC family toxin [Spirochaeta dissipatitropha]
MEILLDTHAIIWWLSDSPELPEQWASEFAVPKNNCFLSSASVWEIAIKSSLGKISIPDNYLTILRKQGFLPLPISWSHAPSVASLPLIHRDPFDRLIISQAITENMILASRDKIMEEYPVQLL